MIAFIIYSLIFAWLIYKTRFLGLLKDNAISNKLLTFLFCVKVLAVPAFYLFFRISYGGIEKLDAGKFYSDSIVMNHLAYLDFTEYLKMLFGLQDDTPGSFFSKNCIEPSNNWDNGLVKDFLYNDNRVLIRIHSVLHFIAFGSYFVHALFDCVFSFIGLFFIFKTFREFFGGREKTFLLVLVLFPTLWLYTGGLLKEGITLFFMGLLLYQLNVFINGKRSLSRVILIFFLFFISLLLKPYILFYGAVLFGIFFVLRKTRFKFQTILFLGLLLIIVLAVNLASVLTRNRSLLEAAKKRETEFRDLSTGGIFLLDSIKFIRVPYDTNLVSRVKDKPGFFTVKNGVPFTYWEHSHQQDTLYCKFNSDTLTRFSLVYILPKAGSGINVLGDSNNYFIIAMRSLYYTLAHPFFFNAKGMMQQFASLENLLLCLCVVMSLIGFLYSTKEKFPGFAFLFFGLSVFILIGFTTPNSGAIMRYRAPAAIFIIMSALYFYDEIKLVLRKIFN
jgi:hypothetical protein